MKNISLIYFVFLTFSLSGFAQSNKTALVILGSDHLAQIYNKELPNSDVYLDKSQRGLGLFASKIASFKPEVLMVEVVPERQGEIDSLYHLYTQDKLQLPNLSDGRSEVYQLAFRIGKALRLPKIYCVNAPGGTSQGILDNGDNINLYKTEGLQLRALATAKTNQFKEGSLSIQAYLKFLNQPEIAQKIYHLRYITPARVMNGKFKNPDAMVDTAFINPRYIGAELTSVFKNRDYKIYANIIAAKAQAKPKRMLLIIGVAHIGSLKSIIRDDEEFEIVDALKYIGK